jgi:ferritin-like metal-binding protein YciE
MEPTPRVPGGGGGGKPRGNEEGATEMFERLNTPEEAYNFELGAALKMEQTLLEKILSDSIDEAQDGALKDLFREHADETRQHIANLERVFAAFGSELDDSPCPAIEAIHKEGKANIKKSDDSIVDSIILKGALETEHHEIAVYEHLIINARAMGRDDVVTMLQPNLDSEKATLEKVRGKAEQVAAVSPTSA